LSAILYTLKNRKIAMIKGILGRKVGMTQIYDETGKAIPVTVIQAGPCNVLQVRSDEKDGYSAIQVGFLDKPRRLAARSERGHVSKDLVSKRSKARAEAGVTPTPKANCEPQRFVREFRGATEGYEVGQQFTVEKFNEVKAVDVAGISRGRGFQGVMKRHGYKGQRASHGVKKVHRHAGTTGALGAWRGGGRSKKGKSMPGQMGNERVTVRNLKVVKVDLENNLLLVRGAVPGAKGTMLMIRETNKVG
jgi:large subunit ribosomal protein L3